MKIIDAGQYVSLEGSDAGQLRCRITVRTDDGRQVSIPTSEETVNQIIELMHGMTPAESIDTPRAYPEKASFFGGSTDVITSAPSIGSISEEGLTQVEMVPSLGRAPVPARAPHVAKDEAGYPIVQQRSAQPDFMDEEDPGEQI